MGGGPLVGGGPGRLLLLLLDPLKAGRSIRLSVIPPPRPPRDDPIEGGPREGGPLGGGPLGWEGGPREPIELLKRLNHYILIRTSNK